jgi:hypothetical protein
LFHGDPAASLTAQVDIHRPINEERAMKNSLTICAGLCAAIGCMTAGSALASDGLDECLARFAEEHLPEGTGLLVTDDAKSAAEQLRARREVHFTADMVLEPGARPFGSVTCVLSRQGKLLYMRADVRPR